MGQTPCLAGNEHPMNMTVILYIEVCIFFPEGSTKESVQILSKSSIVLLTSVNLYPLLTMTTQLEGLTRERPYCPTDCIFGGEKKI